MSFHELRRASLLCYQTDQLSVRHCFTTRLGGVSTGYLATMNLGIHRGDIPGNIEKNCQILGDAIGFDPKKSVFSVQVHRDDIRNVTADDWGKGIYASPDYEADGLITCVPGTALFIFSADCGTILLEDPVTGAVGACHAGWRGTALGIAGKTAREMVRCFGCRPENLHAALGPCISRCCFETDANVPDAMRSAIGDAADAAIDFSPETGKYHVDLKLLNRTVLLQAGLLPENIDISPLCTACDTDTFWSYRHHGMQRGHQAAIIVAGGKA